MTTIPTPGIWKHFNVGTSITSLERLIPFRAYRGIPMVCPLIMQDDTNSPMLMYPNWDSICTYGYNLPVSDYRGRIADMSSGFFHPNYTSEENFHGLAAGITSDSSGNITSVVSGGFNINVNSAYPNYFTLYPVFEGSSSSVRKEGARQKMRGSLYTDWDSYLGVEQTQTNESEWGSIHGIWAQEHNMFSYTIDNSDSERDEVYVTDGWFVLSLPYDTSFGNKLSWEKPAVDVVWRPAESVSTPIYNSFDGEMCLDTTDKNARSTINLNTCSKLLEVVGNTTERFYLIRILPTRIGRGNLVISPPKMRFSVNDSFDNIIIGCYQWGLTFGTSLSTNTIDLSA